ncbi:MAG: DNA polymerase III subunit delta [Paludibacteraceae bacterium]|nr:DNA polymerase III subunit delta [Paludibacteraceae bacterium]
MQFSKIIGQERVKNRLLDNVRSGRIPHAQLFAGQAGVGKLQLAVAFAQYLACPNRSDVDSCGQCPSCLQFQKLEHPDLHFVFPVLKSDSSTPISDDYIAKFRQLFLQQPYFSLSQWTNFMGAGTKMCYIYEKESQEIVRKLNFKSYSAEYKTMIIWLPEKMFGDVCANKLLKLLEEPPEKTLFILVSEQPEKLLPTIISRVQQIRVPRLTEQEIMQAIKERDSDIDITKALDIAHIAEGSFQKALQILEENEENIMFFNFFKELMRNAYRVQARIGMPDALIELRKWSEQMGEASIGREMRIRFLQYCQRMIRENYVLNLQDKQLNYLTEEERKFSVNFAPYINGNNVEQIMTLFSQAQAQIEQNGTARIIFFDMCLQLVVLIKKR